MTGVEILGDQVRFGIPDVPGDPTFDGKLSPDGKTIAGEFAQGGRTLPFRLERSELPADYDDDPYSAYGRPGKPGNGIDGEWLGVMTAGPHRYRLKLTLSDGEAGPSGTIVSVDQGASDLPLDSLAVDDGSVSFGVGRVGASFSGKLNDDGSAISGNWSQGGATLPLTFNRSGE